MLAGHELTIDSYVKLYLTFSSLKTGEKDWVDALVAGIADHVHEADAEQLTGVLSALKEAKQLPARLNQNIEQRSLELVGSLTLKQVMDLADYFGFEHKS